MTWFGIDFTAFANGVMGLALALIGWAAVEVGRRTKRAEQAPVGEVKMQGAAIISSEPVARLVSALEAYTTALTARRIDDEKARALGYRLVEAVTNLSGELAEVRRDDAAACI